MADVAYLDTNGLTVLIGESGTGKGTLLEGLELLRRAAFPQFADEFMQVHRGFPMLLRAGESILRLGVTVQDPAPLRWEVALEDDGGGGRLRVVEETLLLGPSPGETEPLKVIDRDRGGARMFDQAQRKLVAIDVPEQAFLLSSFGLHPPHHAIASVVAALRGISVHLPFDSTPGWVGRERRRASPLRESQVIELADRLLRYGVNLANAYSALRNDFGDDHWRETMEYVRLGLGSGLESINVRPDPGGGAVALQVKYRDQQQQVPGFALSEGTLTYLAFVALYRIDKGSTLVAFDEPENHLHPQLMMRVLGFFEEMATRHPVLLATHSDRLLDGLEAPADAACLVTLNDKRELEVQRPDGPALHQWLRRYRGLGEMRAAGYEASVFKPVAGAQGCAGTARWLRRHAAHSPRR